MTRADLVAFLTPKAPVVDPVHDLSGSNRQAILDAAVKLAELILAHAPESEDRDLALAVIVDLVEHAGGLISDGRSRVLQEREVAREAERVASRAVAPGETAGFFGAPLTPNETIREREQGAIDERERAAGHRVTDGPDPDRIVR